MVQGDLTFSFSAFFVLHFIINDGLGILTVMADADDKLNSVSELNNVMVDFMENIHCSTSTFFVAVFSLFIFT